MEDARCEVPGVGGADRHCGAGMIRRAAILFVSLLALLIVMGEWDRHDPKQITEVQYGN